MENTLLSTVISCIPDIIKNTHLDIKLEGWPATVTSVSGCITLVTVVALVTKDRKAAPREEEAAYFLSTIKLFTPPAARRFLLPV